MSTKFSIDNGLMHLIKEAQRLGHHPSAKEALEAALSAYVTKHKQMKILDLFGKIDYDETLRLQTGTKS